MEEWITKKKKIVKERNRKFKKKMAYLFDFFLNLKRYDQHQHQHITTTPNKQHPPINSINHITLK